MFSLRTFLIREPIMDNLLKRLEDVPYLETDIRILRDDIPILSKQSDIEDSILKNIKFKIKKSVSYLNLWVLLGKWYIIQLFNINFFLQKKKDIQPANSEHLISALKENTSIGSIIFKADKPLSEIKKVSFNQQTVELVINALNCVKYLKNLVIHNSNKALTSAIGTLLKQTSVIKTITIHSKYFIC